MPSTHFLRLALFALSVLSVTALGPGGHWDDWDEVDPNLSTTIVAAMCFNPRATNLASTTGIRMTGVPEDSQDEDHQYEYYEQEEESEPTIRRRWGGHRSHKVRNHRGHVVVVDEFGN